MYYSAKRGLAITSPVHLSVTLVDHDHIGGKSWKLTAQTISPTPSLFVAQCHDHPPTPRELGEILGRLEVGWEKVACWAQKRQCLWNALR